MNISDLLNLGPQSAQWLSSVGISSAEELRNIGSVEAYKRVQAAGFEPSLNLLWAIEAGLQGIDWRELPEAVKDQLIKKLEVRSEK